MNYAEIKFVLSVKRGSKGVHVRRVQEWLTLHGYNVAVDEIFGPATEKALRKFQKANKLTVTGVSDQRTFELLVAPMSKALQRIDGAGETLASLTLKYAKQHLVPHPREVGGQNRGPWVRLYMKGNEGISWPWCAGFVCFCVQQASETLNVQMPFKYTFSCDTLAAFGKQNKAFVSGSDVKPSGLQKGCIFLVRKTSTDWTHTGFVSVFDEESFDTIEGNTNNDARREGPREGYEVCASIREYRKKDFVIL